MKTWFFTEDAYPYLPDADTYESIRVNLPNKHYDPDKGADLYDMYLDLWCAADEIGLEIMLNEHHQTATCVVPAAPILLGILARQTSRARLLILGNPIANRTQPIRVAEEMAMIDVISRGRLECGFVRPSANLDYDRQRRQCRAGGAARPYWRRIPGWLSAHSRDI